MEPHPAHLHTRLCCVRAYGGVVRVQHARTVVRLSGCAFILDYQKEVLRCGIASGFGVEDGAGKASLHEGGSKFLLLSRSRCRTHRTGGRGIPVSLLCQSDQLSNLSGLHAMPMHASCLAASSSFPQLSWSS
jgi:hypothetical protein